MVRSLVIVLVVIAAAAARAESATDEVGAANTAYAALDYEGCVSAAERSFALPGESAARVDAYRLLGLCKAALGDTDAARDAFAKMLGIDPRAALPPGLSPRFTSAFLEARGFWVGKTPLALEVMGEERQGRTRVFTLKLHDELGLMDRVTWRAADQDQGEPSRAAAQMELEVPADVATEIVALDEGGGVLATLDIAAPARAPTPKETAPVETAETEGSFLASPWLWVGVGAVAAVVVIGAAVGVGIGVAFYEPRSVTLTSAVEFGE